MIFITILVAGQAILPSRIDLNSSILTSKNRSQLNGPKENQTSSFSEKVLEPETNEHEDSSPSAKRVKLDEGLSNTVSNLSKDTCNNFPPNFLRSDQPLPPPMTSTSHPLQFEYWAVRKATLIPDNQYNQAMEAVSSLKTILSNLVPNIKVRLFGNWNLKLKFPAKQQDLLVFAYTPNDMSADLCDKLRKLPVFKQYLKRISFNLIKKVGSSEDDGILHMKYSPTNLKVSFLTPKIPGSLMEFQVCRMLEYLCQFDPRCHALITLATYWVTINSIDLSAKATHPKNPLELPQHYTIQWLVIFFMSQGNYIPSPRQVQKESFSKDLTMTDEISGTIIGFSWNPNYVNFWRKNKEDANLLHDARRDYCVSVDERSEEFLLSLLKLFHKFLHFCQSTLGNYKNLILNTADGVLIEIDDLYNTDLCRWKKVVKTKDIIDLKNAVEKETREKGKCEMYMTHPFVVSQKIALSDDIKEKLRMFRWADGKMDAFLIRMKRHGVQAALANGRTLKSILSQ